MAHPPEECAISAPFCPILRSAPVALSSGSPASNEKLVAALCGSEQEPSA
jgi:hypothetical protein